MEVRPIFVPDKCCLCQNQFSIDYWPVKLLCQCVIAKCQICVLQDFACQHKTYNAGIFCEICKFLTTTTKAVIDIVKKEEDRLFKRALKRCNHHSKNPTLKTLQSIVGKLSQEKLIPPDFERTLREKKPDIAILRLVIARVEYACISVAEKEKDNKERPPLHSDDIDGVPSSSLPWGPLRFLQLIKNHYLIKLILYKQLKSEFQDTCRVCFEPLKLGESVNLVCPCLVLHCQNCAVNDRQNLPFPLKNCARCVFCKQVTESIVDGTHEAEVCQKTLLADAEVALRSWGFHEKLNGSKGIGNAIQVFIANDLIPYNYVLRDGSFSLDQYRLELSRLQHHHEQMKEAYNEAYPDRKLNISKTTKLTDEESLIVPLTTFRGSSLPLGPLEKLSIYRNPFIELYLQYFNDDVEDEDVNDCAVEDIDNLFRGKTFQPTAAIIASLKASQSAESFLKQQRKQQQSSSIRYEMVHSTFSCAYCPIHFGTKDDYLKHVENYHDDLDMTLVKANVPTLGTETETVGDTMSERLPEQGEEDDSDLQSIERYSDFHQERQVSLQSAEEEVNSDMNDFIRANEELLSTWQLNQSSQMEETEVSYTVASAIAESVRRRADEDNEEEGISQSDKNHKVHFPITEVKQTTTGFEGLQNVAMDILQQVRLKAVYEVIFHHSNDLMFYNKTDTPIVIAPDYLFYYSIDLADEDHEMLYEFSATYRSFFRGSTPPTLLPGKKNPLLGALLLHTNQRSVASIKFALENQAGFQGIISAFRSPSGRSLLSKRSLLYYHLPKGTKISIRPLDWRRQESYHVQHYDQLLQNRMMMKNRYSKKKKLSKLKIANAIIRERFALSRMPTKAIIEAEAEDGEADEESDVLSSPQPPSNQIHKSIVSHDAHLKAADRYEARLLQSDDSSEENEEEKERKRQAKMNRGKAFVKHESNTLDIPYPIKPFQHARDMKKNASHKRKLASKLATNSSTQKTWQTSSQYHPQQNQHQPQQQHQSSTSSSMISMQVDSRGHTNLVSQPPIAAQRESSMYSNDFNRQKNDLYTNHFLEDLNPLEYLNPDHNHHHDSSYYTYPPRNASNHHRNTNNRRRSRSPELSHHNHELSKKSRPALNQHLSQQYSYSHNPNLHFAANRALFKPLEETKYHDLYNEPERKTTTTTTTTTTSSNPPTTTTTTSSSSSRFPFKPY
jgi:hypothetical protein